MDRKMTLLAIGACAFVTAAVVTLVHFLNGGSTDPRETPTSTATAIVSPANGLADPSGHRDGAEWTAPTTPTATSGAVVDDHADPDDPPSPPTTTLPAGQWTGSEPTDLPTTGQTDTWRTVADQFAQDLSNTSDGWAARLSTHATPTYAETLTYADPRTAPTGAPTLPVKVLSESATLVEAQATYPSGDRVVLRLVMDADGWKVAGASEAP